MAHYNDPYSLAYDWATENKQGDYGSPTGGKCPISGRNRRTFHTCGDTILSYGMQLAHIERRQNGTYVMLDYLPRSNGGHGSTATTNRHIRALEGALWDAGTWEPSAGKFGGYRLKYCNRTAS